MNLKPNTLIPLTLAAALTLGLTACGGASSSADDDVGEAAAALVVADETSVDGEVAGAGADPAMANADAAGLADEAADAETNEALDDVEPCDFSARRDAVVARFDANGDGELDARERVALRLAARDGRGDRPDRARPHVWRRVRWAFDVNGDRELDAAERAALVEALEARCERRRSATLDRFDADGDGALSRAERLTRRAARAEARAERRERLTEAFDADRNGELSRAELVAGLRARHAAHRAAVARAFDADGSGRLDDAERDALKAAIRARVADGTRLLERVEES